MRMKEEYSQKSNQSSKDVEDEVSDGSLIWSQSQWRQFIVVFTMATIIVSGLFWIFLIRQEIGLQRHYTVLSEQFDKEWSYLQKLSRLYQVQLLSEQEGSQEAVFNGRRLNLSFSYPKVWGQFEESPQQTFHTAIRLKNDTLEKLLGAYNRAPPTEYISGWDSVAIGTWSKEDVGRVCERNTFADTCLTLTTKSGVKYARIRYDHFLLVGGAVSDVVIYVFAHPEGEFPAMALSNIGLRKSGIPHRISEMDVLMESMVFQKL